MLVLVRGRAAHWLSHSEAAAEILHHVPVRQSCVPTPQPERERHDRTASVSVPGSLDVSVTPSLVLRVAKVTGEAPNKLSKMLQLMCYKYLWDNLVADDFPSKKFFTYFGLNPQNNLCEDMKVISADSGFSASTLDDVVRYYRNTFRMLSPVHDQLLWRYASVRQRLAY